MILVVFVKSFDFFMVIILKECNRVELLVVREVLRFYMIFIYIFKFIIFILGFKVNSM